MKQEMMTVVSQKLLGPKIYELILRGELVREMAIPGQFVHIKVPRADLLLRRPISLANIDADNLECTLIYRVEGDGTENMSQLRPGELLDVMGPLGNGFPIEAVQAEEVVFVIGGGIGVPSLYELSQQLQRKGAKVIQIFGFAKAEVIFYADKFAELGEVHISTDDGSYGTHGHAGLLLDDLLTKYQPAAVYACGSNGLLKAVDRNFENHARAYMSLEARMACGMGACYACVCDLKKEKASKKICDEGPIFATGEVVL